MESKKIHNLLNILKQIEEYYNKGYFVYEFDRLLKGEEPLNLISIENNMWQPNKAFMINPLYEPKEALTEGKIYLETIFYLFALWAYKYLTNEEYQMDLNKVKYPGLFQFFQNTMVEDFRERISDFREVELYLKIALDEFQQKFYKVEENDSYKVEGITSVGMIRYENQDSFDFILKDNCLIAVVADGMGGGSCGDIASKIAVNTLMLEFEKIIEMDVKDVDEFLKELTMSINQKIINYKQKNKLKSMGTTMSTVIIKDNRLFFAHVGDSRIYVKFKNSETFKQITLDHSLAEVEFRKGNITKEEKKNYAKNVLAFVLGSEKLTKNDINVTKDYGQIINTEELKDIVICSDGCWDIVKPSSFGKNVKEILQEANNYVTHDNITIVKIIKKNNSKLNNIITNRQDQENENETKNETEVKRYNGLNKNISKYFLGGIFISIVFFIILYFLSSKEDKHKMDFISHTEKNKTKETLQKEKNMLLFDANSTKEKRFVKQNILDKNESNEKVVLKHEDLNLSIKDDNKTFINEINRTESLLIINEMNKTNETKKDSNRTKSVNILDI